MIGAFANLGAEKEAGLGDARCPNCDARDFVKVEDLFYDTLRRAEESGANEAPGIGGLNDEQIIVKFRPPRRRSAVARTIVVLGVLGVAAYVVYRRFGETASEFAIIGALIIASMVFLTTTRRYSDEYFDRKAKWNKLYMCARCGQVVKG